MNIWSISIDIMFYAFITQCGLEQLVNCFNEAAESICIFFDERFWNSSSTAVMKNLLFFDETWRRLILYMLGR